jgi:hypothetical protein
VVGSVVHSVHTDSVDSELLELGNVALATSSVGNGVLSIGSTTYGMLVLDDEVSRARTYLAGSRHRGCRNACRLRRKLQFVSTEANWCHSGVPTVSLDSDWRNGCALLNSSGRGSDSGRKNGSDGTRLHRDEMKVEDKYGWCARGQGVRVNTLKRL